MTQTHYGGFRTLDGEWCIISRDLLEPGTWVSIRRRKDGGEWSTHRVGELYQGQDPLLQVPHPQAADRPDARANKINELFCAIALASYRKVRYIHHQQGAQTMSRSDDFSAVLNGRMTHAEFDAKWPPVTPAQTKAFNQLVDKRNARINRWDAGQRRANAQRRTRKARNS